MHRKEGPNPQVLPAERAEGDYGLTRCRGSEQDTGQRTHMLQCIFEYSCARWSVGNEVSMAADTGARSSLTISCSLTDSH